MPYSNAAASKLAFHLASSAKSAPAAPLIKKSLPPSTRHQLVSASFIPSSATCRYSSSSSSSHENAFTELEHTNWQRGVDAYTEGFGPLTSQAVPTLLEKAGFPPQQSSYGSADDRIANLLDVACGPGQVMNAAISMPEAGSGDRDTSSYSYTALDFSSNFLLLAEKNLKATHPDTTITFVEGDAQAMPFDDNTFTSITCNFGILHLSDPDSFLSESYRILQPGGKLAFSAWSAPPDTEGFDLILGVVKDFGNPNVSLPEGPPFFRFSDPDEIRRSLEAAGFVDVDVTVVDSMTWVNVESADHLYDILLEGTARTRELLRGQTKEETEAIKEELCRRWKERSEDGSRRLRMPAVVSSGLKTVYM